MRPGEVLPPIDLAKVRAEVHAKTWREITDEEFASYLMYPKVFLDYLKDRLDYGRVSVLPTPLFFYGMEPGEEVSVDIERGKTLIVRFVAVSDSARGRHAHGVLRAQRPAALGEGAGSQPGGAASRRVARPTRATPITSAAPMPGTVATVAVSSGRTVARGDVLLTIEAMKMETSVRADRDGTIAESRHQAGRGVDAKDLLVVLA